MKLKTSFFNFRVLKKNLTRFAPLWILYAVGEVMGLLTLDLMRTAKAVHDLNHIMGPVSIFHAVYALLVAACLFGDLFDSRMCNGLHAMPMRREGWLLTGLVSGLVFGLIPAAVGGAVAAVLLREYYWVALVWQATSLLQFVFFFGLAVFSAMCAGKRLGMIAVYAIFNFLSELIYWVATMIYEPLLYGVVLSGDWFNLFCPLVSFVGASYLDTEVHYGSNDVLNLVFNGYDTDAWCYLAVCAGVGIVCMLLSWLLYRRRQLETAGDFISFRPMRMFFLLTYSLGAGALLYSFGDLFGMYKDYGFLVVGVIIGWFTGWMLLERTVKIFTKKVLIGFAAFAILFAGSIGLTLADPLGIVTRVPMAQEIESVCLYPMQDTYMYYSTAYDSGRQVSDPEEVALVQDLHRQMLNTPDTDDEIINIELRYQLKNGFYMYRSYDVPVESEAAENLRPFLSDTRSVFATNDWQQVRDSLYMVHVYPTGDGPSIELSDEAQMQALLDAVEADCKAGNFAQHDYFHKNQEYVAGIDIAWEITPTGSRSPDTRNEHVIIYEDCENVRAFLETLQ